ncbi:MAG: hypothetical protein ACKO96_27525 [Flammeovirgaceae bacterium]
MTEIQFIVNGVVIDQITIDLKELKITESEFEKLTPDQKAVLLEDHIESMSNRISERVEIRSSSIAAVHHNTGKPTEASE